MRFFVLGATRAETDDGTGLDLGARKPRSVAAALAMTPGRPVSADLLADLVWAGEPPRAVLGALHSYLSNLRRSLEPDRRARGADSVIETTDHGYVLRATADEVDAHVFARTAATAERALAPLASLLAGAGDDGSWPSHDQVTSVLVDIDVALDGWRGEPYADLPDHPDVLAARAALEQRRLALEEARLLGLLALGDHSSVLAATETVVGPHQLRERVWALHALALTRSGRQADALDALRTVRGVLGEELGLDPSSELRDLETAVLRQEPALEHVLALATTTSTRPSSGSASPGVMATPTLGREAEAVELAAVVARAADGAASFAQLVGEPGIGKTRLVSDLLEAARERGLRSAVGRCVRDDGAPPMWPWRAVFDELALDPDVTTPSEPGDGSPERRAFELSDRVASALLGAAARSPVLVVLEDLHWADDATLRALTRLVDSAPPASGLAVVVTRRARPEPTGTLAGLGEALARRHAVRLELSGLGPDATLDLVRAAAEKDVPAETARQWHERAAGNPFFLIELARSGPDSAGLPGSVLDVVRRRLSELSDESAERLGTAAVLGARFTVSALAATDEVDRDEVESALEEAVARGLVDEVAPEEYAFVHALTQEAVVGSLAGGGGARRHARAARMIATRPEMSGLDAPTRTAELARHWLAAGPSHVDTAWRAARTAADQASAMTSYPEAMRLRRAAVDAQRRVVSSADDLRYELLLELATDAAYAARWPQVEEAVLEAMALARSLGSPELLGRAAAAMTRYCAWLPHMTGVVVEDAVDDLRWGLRHAGDVATRCRLQLALAVELYYDAGAAAERLALAESGLALARGVGDDSLLWWAACAACMTAWTPSLLDRRTAWAAEGLDSARRAGDRRAEAVLLVHLALASLEGGDRDAWERHLGQADAVARRDRLPFVAMTSHWQRLAVAAARGRSDLVEEHLRGLVAVVADVAVPGQELQAPLAQVVASLWDPQRMRGVVEAFETAQGTTGAGASVVHLLLARVDRAQALREALVAFPVPVPGDEYWSSLSDWAIEAEAASVVGDRHLARRAAAALAPYRGLPVAPGGIGVVGFVDGALALAHATLGELDAAAELADAATLQATSWELSAYVAWLNGRRRALGF